MRAAIITGQGQLDVIEVPDPVPAPGGLVVDIGYCGVCGTDIHAFAHGGPYPPTLCGHEWVGRVTDVGGDVDSYRAGDRVSVAITPACGSCTECRAGLAEWCTVSTMSLAIDPEGTSAHGAYAPRLAVSAQRVVPVPDGLTDEAAAMIEPATVAFHGVRRAGIRVGDRVVVQGAGPIGAFALQWARVHGAQQVIVVEPNVTRAKLATTLGADLVVSPADAPDAIRDATAGLGADVVVECAGIPATIQSAVDAARRGGQVMLIGLSDLPATITPTTWLMKEVTVRGSIAYTRDDFTRCVPMLAAGRVRTDALHTSTVALDDLPDVLRRLSSGAAEEVKVLVRP